VSTAYVPQRNAVFLSFAFGMAEECDADEVWLGVNSSLPWIGDEDEEGEEEGEEDEVVCETCGQVLLDDDEEEEDEDEGPGWEQLGFPDADEVFLEEMESSLNNGSVRALNGRYVTIRSPVSRLTKKDIVTLGRQLEVPFDLTYSCYEGAETPCGACDACIPRMEGFKEADQGEGASV
jgi:7-cyano-7-deazaguanine synthase in queuosine biosynthesis